MGILDCLYQPKNSLNLFVIPLWSSIHILACGGVYPKAFVGMGKQKFCETFSLARSLSFARYWCLEVGELQIQYWAAEMPVSSSVPVLLRLVKTHVFPQNKELSQSNLKDFIVTPKPLIHESKEKIAPQEQNNMIFSFYLSIMESGNILVKQWMVLNPENREAEDSCQQYQMVDMIIIAVPFYYVSLALHTPKKRAGPTISPIVGSPCRYIAQDNNIWESKP